MNAKLYQCPYSKATKCACDEPCLGCETFADHNIEVADSPKHHVYKYYWGDRINHGESKGLLNAILRASGETNKYKEHVRLKRDFLYSRITNISEIPQKKLKRGVCWISENSLMQMNDSISYSLIKNTIIVLTYDYNIQEDKIVGYIPSMSRDMTTFKEMKAYIDCCEHRLFSDLQGSM